MLSGGAGRAAMNTTRMSGKMLPVKHLHWWSQCLSIVLSWRPDVVRITGAAHHNWRGNNTFCG
jgi:hypothetical protein